MMKHFFMRALDKSSRRQVIKEFSLCLVSENVTIFKQGEIGNYFYIIKEGKVDLIINDKFIKSLSNGDSFGELALLHGASRSGTIKTSKTTTMWVLPRAKFRSVIDHINKENFEDNKKFLQSVPLLANIDSDQKTILCSNMIKEVYDKGIYIVKGIIGFIIENDVANCLYIIKEGEVECMIGEKVIRSLGVGEYFGEKSILMQINRTMDVKTKSPAIVYSISIETLKMLMGENFQDLLLFNLVRLIFSNSQYLSDVNSTVLENCFNNFNFYNFGKNQIVLKKGSSKVKKIITVVEGNIIDSKSKKIVAQRGSILYERDIFELNDETIPEDLIADPDCLLCECDVEFFQKSTGKNFKELKERNNLIESLKSIPLFKNFTYKKIEILANIIKIEEFESGRKIIVQGEHSNKFYILKKGRIDIFVNNNYIRTLNPNEYFGERALFFNEPRSATAVATDNVMAFAIDKEDFKKIIESNLKDYLITRFFLQDNTVQLEDLDYIKELGNGNYGTVSLVTTRTTGFFYAIKSISRLQIDHEQLHKNLELERSILLQIDHPFIVKLVKTLKDSRFIYFLMEYIKGKELFDVIREIGLLNNYQCKFYGCSIILAVEYLHERKFIYRDIKPENIIVNEKGFIKLIDFGTAKTITDRTSTILGTPHYMAPEVILGEGYSFPVDIWSIAICIYEFKCGGVPFGETADDPMDVYLAIINDKIKYPTFVKDKDFMQLMNSMLNKNPMSRLYKINQVKAHTWFDDFSWENLNSLNLTPPYMPRVIKEDTSKNKPFVKHAKSMKEWVPPKDSAIDQKLKEEYDKWHKDF